MSETIIREDDEYLYIQPDILTIIGIKKPTKEFLDSQYPYTIDVEIDISDLTNNKNK